jgi:hypothetical protein
MGFELDDLGAVSCLSLILGFFIQISSHAEEVQAAREAES